MFPWECDIESNLQTLRDHGVVGPHHCINLEEQRICGQLSITFFFQKYRYLQVTVMETLIDAPSRGIKGGFDPFI